LPLSYSAHAESVGNALSTKKTEKEEMKTIAVSKEKELKKNPSEDDNEDDDELGMEIVETKETKRDDSSESRHTDANEQESDEDSGTSQHKDKQSAKSRPTK
jgi:hypothetical protein